MRMCGGLPFSKQAIKPEEIAEAENVSWRIAIEAEAQVEVDLLNVGNAVTASGIEKVAGTAAQGIVADILDENK